MAITSVLFFTAWWPLVSFPEFAFVQSADTPTKQLESSPNVTEAWICLSPVFGDDLNHRYFDFWTQYHLDLGFKTIQGYYHNNNTNVDTIEYLHQSRLRVEGVTLPNDCTFFNCVQLETQRDCFKKAKQHNASWVLFMDIDEFFFTGPLSLPSLLDSHARYSHLTLGIFVYNVTDCARSAGRDIGLSTAYRHISFRFKEPFCCTTRTGGFNLTIHSNRRAERYPGFRSAHCVNSCGKRKVLVNVNSGIRPGNIFTHFCAYPDGLDVNISEFRINEIPGGPIVRDESVCLFYNKELVNPTQYVSDPFF
jgi:hypothetical protein